MTNNPAERIQQKQCRLTELGKMLDLHSGRTLPTAMMEATENEQFRLEFRLKTLVDEFKERELDIKIQSMEAVLQILNTNNVQKETQ
jgi:hypothetical protein